MNRTNREARELGHTTGRSAPATPTPPREAERRNPPAVSTASGNPDHNGAPTAPDRPPLPTLRIGEAEREWLGLEIEAFGRSVADPAVQARYEQLRAAVASGEIGTEHVEALERVLEVALASGRVRHRYGPAGEQALTRLYHQTPRGAQVVARVREVNAALTALKGQVLDEIAFAAKLPGEFTLTLDTDRCQITIRIDRTGVQVENVAVGI